VDSAVAAVVAVGAGVESPPDELTEVPRGTNVGVGRAVADLVGVGEEVKRGVGLEIVVEVA
jgi:hypothetical protein